MFARAHYCAMVQCGDSSGQTTLAAAPAAIEEQCFDAAVVGGGFAGTMVAVQLARLAAGPLRIVMFDREGAFGRGAAYSPLSDGCLLNVRAKAMGAFPSDEGDFVRWLRDVGYAAGDRELGERFLPRRLYGEYLCSLLAGSAAEPVRLERRAESVEELARHDAGFRLTTGSGNAILGKAVVLAIGNLPAGNFAHAGLAAAILKHARHAWELLAHGSLDRDADVLIVGTGLSALDVLVQLADNRHRGRIEMISRHGRFPLPHAASAASTPLSLGAIAGTPSDVLRALRRAARDTAGAGRTWQEVLDALRPQINRIWQSWTLDEQRRFYRHLEPLWEVHRHRAPPATLAVRDALLAAGRLRVHRGILREIVPVGKRLRVAYAARGSQTRTVIETDEIVDCTGPRREFAKCNDALIEALFARGLATPGPLGVGLAADADGSLRQAGGGAPMYALGSPLRGTLCESGAVREIRAQALTIAQAILAGRG